MLTVIASIDILVMLWIPIMVLVITVIAYITTPTLPPTTISKVSYIDIDEDVIITTHNSLLLALNTVNQDIIQANSTVQQLQLQVDTLSQKIALVNSIG